MEGTKQSDSILKLIRIYDSELDESEKVLLSAKYEVLHQFSSKDTEEDLIKVYDTYLAENGITREHTELNYDDYIVLVEYSKDGNFLGSIYNIYAIRGELQLDTVEHDVRVEVSVALGVNDNIRW